jgi:hypothetical protein
MGGLYRSEKDSDGCVRDVDGECIFAGRVCLVVRGWMAGIAGLRWEIVRRRRVEWIWIWNIWLCRISGGIGASACVEEDPSLDCLAEAERKLCKSG